MAHFAELHPVTSHVIRVIVVSNQVTHDEKGVEHEERGIAFCKQLYGEDTEWVQTSYSGSFRGFFASTNFRYDEVSDTFIPLGSQP